MPIDLKPCPFCGGLPHPETTVCDNSVRCTICGARIIRFNDNNCAIQKPSAVDMWNTRATTPEQPDELTKTLIADEKENVWKDDNGDIWEPIRAQKRVRDLILIARTTLERKLQASDYVRPDSEPALYAQAAYICEDINEFIHLAHGWIEKAEIILSSMEGACTDTTSPEGHCLIQPPPPDYPKRESQPVEYTPDPKGLHDVIADVIDKKRTNFMLVENMVRAIKPFLINENEIKRLQKIEWCVKQHGIDLVRKDLGLPKRESSDFNKGEFMLTDEQIEYMTMRFLGWKLPADFRPDCGIHFDADAAKKLNPNNATYEPNGTNLFDYMQAKNMVRYMAEGMPPLSKIEDGKPRG